MKLSEEITPEAELLLLCCRAELDEHRIGYLLKCGLAWDEFLGLAMAHRVWPRIYRRLHSSFRAAVPKDVLATLRRSYAEHALNNQFILVELGELLGCFADHKLPAIPFKGPVLAVSGYGELASRPFRDLDILVPQSEFSRAKELLASLGYQATKEFSWEATLVHPRRGVAVDLHFDIAYRLYSVPLDFWRLWRETQEIEIEGTKIHGLSAADGLLVLCVQLVSDWTGGQRRLAKLLDIDASVRSWLDPDWDRLIDEVKRLDALRILFLGLELPRQVLGTPLPSWVAQRIESCVPVRALATDTKAALFRERSSKPDLGHQLVVYVKLRERFQLRLVYCVQIAKLRIECADYDSAALPWLSRLLIHWSLRPAWHVLRFARRLLSRR